MDGRVVAGVGRGVALNQEKEAWPLLLLKFELFLKEKHLRKYV